MLKQLFGKIRSLLSRAHKPVVWRELSLGEDILVGDEYNSRGNGDTGSNHLQAPSDAGGWVVVRMPRSDKVDEIALKFLRYRRRIS